MQLKDLKVVICYIWNITDIVCLFKNFKRLTHITLLWYTAQLQGHWFYQYLNTDGCQELLTAIGTVDTQNIEKYRQELKFKQT